MSSSNCRISSPKVASGVSWIALSRRLSSSGPIFAFRPRRFTRKSTLPVSRFCRASRYTSRSDTPYASAISWALWVRSYPATNNRRASLCSILLTSSFILLHFYVLFVSSALFCAGCSNVVIPLRRSNHTRRDGRRNKSRTSDRTGDWNLGRT